MRRMELTQRALAGKGRPGDPPGRGRPWLPTLAAMVGAVVASLALAASASAGLQQEFVAFGDCPVANPAVTNCIYSKVTGGEFTLGSKTVQITKPVILQGGTAGSSDKLIAAADGETLSRTALTVPGGLIGVEGLGGEVTATAELAGTVELNAEHLLTANGTAVALPLKVKLDNPVLGSACFVGSSAEPIAINLTTGTTDPPAPNKPITGNPGHQELIDGDKVTVIPSSTLLDNAFAVPGANGCGGLLSLLVDPAVDLSAGVPAAAGHNTAIMSGLLEVASAQAVRAQAVLPELGRCEPAESTGSGKTAVFHGDYFDSACTASESAKLGHYEWFPGPGAHNRFSGRAKVGLQGVGGGKVTCSGGSASGEYTGPKTLVDSLVLTGCKSQTTKGLCQSSGAAAGEIVTGPLAGSLGIISDEVKGAETTVSVGVDLSHEPTLLRAECTGAAEALVVKGSVILPVKKADKMGTSFTLTGKETGGKQAPEAFEVGAKDTLTATLGAGSEQTGATASQKLSNEEPLEIKAIAN